MPKVVSSLKPVMREIREIHDDIDTATQRRAELWHVLSEGHDAGAAGELAALNARIEQLWDEHRQARATLRFGDREEIIHRARAEERLHRAA
jgi:hypothetical protein